MNLSQKLLPMMIVGEPVLRMPGRFLSKEEILSPEIQELIHNMKATMQAAPGVGLAAPQIGQSLQICVIEDRIEYFRHLSSQQLVERDRVPVSLQVVINPKIYLEDDEKTEFFEACLSIPHYVALVPRAKKIRVECLNENAEPVVIQAKGWHARILQHEIDHLNGLLFIDRADPKTMMTKESYARLWQSTSTDVIKQKLGITE